MADLADDLIGEIRLGRGGRGRFRNTNFGKARRGRAGGSLFSARARNLWRVAQGSNAAVLKKINRGGTHTGPAAYVEGGRAADTATHPELRAAIQRIHDLGYLAG